MRSFTLFAGLKNSSLATTSAPAPSVTRFSRTSGVPPTSCVTSSAMLMKLPPGGVGTGPIGLPGDVEYAGHQRDWHLEMFL